MTLNEYIDNVDESIREEFVSALPDKEWPTKQDGGLKAAALKELDAILSGLTDDEDGDCVVLKIGAYIKGKLISGGETVCGDDAKIAKKAGVA